MIDNWVQSTFLIIEIDSIFVDSINLDSAVTLGNVCGSSAFSDRFGYYEKNITHSESSINIIIKSTINEDYNKASFGIREFYILVDNVSNIYYSSNIYSNF